MNRICVFCGSSSGGGPEFAQTAAEMGHILADRDIGLVYGGANIGTMGALADATLDAGGSVIGVMPEALIEEQAHTGLSELHTISHEYQHDAMHARKVRMVELSDGFIALPGGLGTVEEFFEILFWAQLGIHQHPCGLLNSFDYYRGVIDFLDHAVSRQFFSKEHRTRVIVENTPETLLDRFEAYKKNQRGK
jgi:uncharacterized protein (TIGR00730 family)